MVEACKRVGRSATDGQRYKEHMIASGFANVVETKYMWPSNQWPKDKNPIFFIRSVVRQPVRASAPPKDAARETQRGLARG